MRKVLLCRQPLGTIYRYTDDLAQVPLVLLSTKDCGSCIYIGNKMVQDICMSRQAFAELEVWVQDTPLQRFNALLPHLSPNLRLENLQRLIDGDLRLIGDAIIEGKRISRYDVVKEPRAWSFDAGADAYKVIERGYEAGELVTHINTKDTVYIIARINGDTAKLNFAMAPFKHALSGSLKYLRPFNGEVILRNR